MLTRLREGRTSSGWMTQWHTYQPEGEQACSGVPGLEHRLDPTPREGWDGKGVFIFLAHGPLGSSPSDDFLLSFCGVGVEPRTSHLLDKRSPLATPQPSLFLILRQGLHALSRPGWNLQSSHVVRCPVPMLGDVALS